MAEIFTFIKRCVARKTQVWSSNVKGHSYRFKVKLLDLLVLTTERILKLLCTNYHHDETVCRVKNRSVVQRSGSQWQIKGLT